MPLSKETAGAWLVAFIISGPAMTLFLSLRAASDLKSWSSWWERKLGCGACAREKSREEVGGEEGQVGPSQNPLHGGSGNETEVQEQQNPTHGGIEMKNLPQGSAAEEGRAGNALALVGSGPASAL